MKQVAKTVSNIHNFSIYFNPTADERFYDH